MAKVMPEKKRLAWVIKDFSALPSDSFYSAPFLFSGIKWRFFFYPKGYTSNHNLNVFLSFVDGQSLPSGWGRFVNIRVTLVNRTAYENSIHREDHLWFEEKFAGWGWGPSEFLPLSKLNAKDSGFLKEDELRIVADLETLEVIGRLDDESKEASEPLKKIMDVNGFQVLPSQEESLRSIFELHPDIASEFRGKNQQLRTTSMNFLLNLVETLRQPLTELSNEDLEEADIALAYLKNASFKVDWLETELNQVKEKKETEKD